MTTFNFISNFTKLFHNGSTSESSQSKVGGNSSVEHFLSFTILLLFLTLGVGNVWGATATITFADEGLSNGVQYSDPFDIDANVTITFAGGGNDGKYYDTGSGIRTYAGGSFTINAGSGTITQVDFTWDGSNKPTTDAASPTGYNTSQNKWTGSASSITLTRPSGSGHWRLQSVTVTYTPSGGGGTYTVTLSKNGSTSNISGCSGTYTLPTTGEHVANACPEWTFHCWANATYAKSSTAPSSSVITTMSSAGTAYAVYKHSEGGGGGSTSTFVASSQGYSNASQASEKVIDGVTYTWGDGALYYTSGSSVRMYADNTLTITASSAITAIDFTYSQGALVQAGASTGTITNGDWSGSANSITFTNTTGSQVRISQIVVTLGAAGTTYYSTDAECGPRVQATTSPWVTSTNGQFVKVEVPVTATNFDKSSTLSASVSGAGFSIVGWGANGNSVTKDVDLETTLILAYNPSAYNTTADATITFSSDYSGSLTPIYNNGTVHGRSLPEKFVIAIKNDDQWYALPANMSGSGTYAGVAVNVDNTTTPTKVTAGPATALYSLLNVYKISGAGDRYAEYGTRVRFLGNEKCLWSNSANGGTGINNGAVPTSANSDNYEWTLVTTDGVIYAINTNVAKKIEEGRELRYFAGESKFGMYASGNSSFRFLPVDCDSRATVTNVSSTYNSVTLTWAGKSGTEYNVYIEEGGVTKKTENNVSSPVTISGLDSETNYTWIISPGAKDNGCALSGAFTTNVAPINVTLSCDGTEHALGAQDKPYTLPTTGAYVANACTEWEFAGWTDGTYSKSTSAPTFITEMNASGTAYAVYKHTTDGGSTGTLTLTQGPTSGSSYNTSYSTTEYTSESDAITIQSNNILNGSSNIQLKAGTGNRIYNSTAMPGNITQITVTATTGDAYVYVGSSSVSSGSTELTPTTGSTDGTAVYTIPAGNTYFAVGATSSYVIVSSIEVEYSSSTTYYSTTSECCNEVAPPTVSVEAVDISATISWDNQVGATNGYHVTCSNGTDQDVAAGVTSLEITGLSPLTEYEYTVTAKGATCNRSYTSTFTTASCYVVPTGVSVTPGTSSVIVRWVHTAPKASVTIYSDNTCSDVVKTEDNLTTGCTISGLEEGRTYFLKVFAGTGCGSAAVEFTTLSSAVIIAEWFPDSIRINLTADTATATVLIEDKQTTSTATTSYADDIFFSKYFEAASNVKLIAIYNGTDHNVDLSDYQLGIAMKTDGSSHPFSYYNFRGGTNPMKYVLEGDYDTKLSFTEEQLLLTPGSEIILISYQNNNTADANITQCARENPNSGFEHYYRLTTPFMQFNGDDAVALFDSSGKMIDLIGAGTKAGGLNTSSLVAASGSDGDVNGFMDNPGGWFTTKGYQVLENNGESPNYKLSSNRCLLIRRNHVKSGADAVERNQTDFLTLGDYEYLGENYEGEWRGLEIPGHSGSAGKTASCNGFNEVGSYDYNAYYAKFDSITTVDELGGKQNDDGTYTIPIPYLDTLSCTMLRVNVYEGTELKTSAEYKVPIMVDDTVAWTTNDTIFHNSKHNAAACAECDVVILKGATLTKTNAGANDVTTIRNLTIYPGGTMVVPNTRTFNVSSVQFRVEGERVPQAKLQGDLITSDQQVIVTRRINNDRYYFFSLPYDCNVSDIRWSNGETPVRGTEYQILEYNAERRAAEGSTKGAPGHWKNAGNVLHAGVGYNVAVNSKYLKELIFPMAIDQTNLTDKENTKTSNTVALTKNVGPTSKNNHNWNLVAHPYVSPFNAYSNAKITAGYLECEFINEGMDTTWHRYETDKVYLTMPSFAAEKITYEQRLSTGISSMDPFLAVFVQAAAEGDLTFDESNRKLSAPSRRWAAKAENEDQSIFVGVTLSGNGQSDQTNLRIRPDFTSEYQLGYDLQKFTTFYTSRPQIYMKPADLQLAFQAVNDDAAKTSFIPVGVYCYKAGTYTFALSEDYPIDEVEAVYLHDAVTGETTNLLYDTYTITTDKQLYTNARFSLNVIVNRRAPQVTTDIDVTNAPDNLVRKILINGHVYIQRGAELYDVTGKHMSNL